MSASACPPDERRNQIVAGVLTAATVLLVGYASGSGHVLGALTPPMPFSGASPSLRGSSDGTDGTAPGQPTEASGPGAGSGGPSTAGDHGVPETVPANSPAHADEPPLHGGASPGGTEAPCTTDLLSAMASPFWTHVQKAHLETSPSQQAAEALNTDRYLRTHTVLLEELLGPLVAATTHAADAAETFWLHMRNAHLESAPGQQVQEARNTDQYVKTHTVLLEELLTPAGNAVTGNCG